jgi:hypothetical protein
MSEVEESACRQFKWVTRRLATALVPEQFRFRQQTAFPRQLGFHDGLQIIVFRLPPKNLPNSLGLCDQRRRIAGAARRGNDI